MDEVDEVEMAVKQGVVGGEEDRYEWIWWNIPEIVIKENRGLL